MNTTSLHDPRRTKGGTTNKIKEFKVLKIPIAGEIGAGRVVPFIPRSELVPVVVPASLPESSILTLTVRGISLTDLGIMDGDVLILRNKFSWREIGEDTICAVFIHSTGELCAKKIIRGANTLFLRASGGGIPDKEVTPDDVEIRGIAIAVQRPL